MSLKDGCGTSAFILLMKNKITAITKPINNIGNIPKYMNLVFSNPEDEVKLNGPNSTMDHSVSHETTPYKPPGPSRCHSLRGKPSFANEL